MALFSMELDNLRLLFLKELRDLYDAENKLPKLCQSLSRPRITES